MVALVSATVRYRRSWQRHVARRTFGLAPARSETRLGCDGGLVEGGGATNEQRDFAQVVPPPRGVHAGGGESPMGFKDWLQTRSEDVFIISESHFTHLDNLVEIEGNQVRLLESPDNLIFME